MKQSEERQALELIWASVRCLYKKYGIPELELDCKRILIEALDERDQLKERLAAYEAAEEAETYRGVEDL